MSGSTFGVIGLGTMGRNLALNIEDHGFPVGVWNLETEWTDAFVRDHPKAKFTGAKTLEALVAGLERPRRIVMMIPAGAPVDEMIGKLSPLLESGDILIDGGNSNFEDTRRREAALRESGRNFAGCGVSGGEEGARYGPSIMPGGSDAAWTRIKDVLEAIAAKTEAGPCVTHVGPDRAGRAGPGRRDPDDRRGDRRARAVQSQRGARRREPDTGRDRNDRVHRWRPRRMEERPARCALRRAGLQLRAGDGAHRRRVGEIRVERQPRGNGAHLEGRVHHPRPAARSGAAGVHREPVPGQPAGRSRDRARDAERRARLAPRRRRGRVERHPRPGAGRQPRVFRQLPDRAPAAEPDPGAARRVRRAQVRTGGASGLRPRGLGTFEGLTGLLAIWRLGNLEL